MGRRYESDKRHRDSQRDSHEACVQLRHHAGRLRCLARFGKGTASRHQTRSQHVQRCHLWHFLSWQRSYPSFSLLYFISSLQKTMAESLVQQMEKDGFLPCVDTLNALLMMYVKRKVPRSPLWVRHASQKLSSMCFDQILLSDMESRGVVPNDKTLRYLVYIAESENDLQQIRQRLTTMQGRPSFEAWRSLVKKHFELDCTYILPLVQLKEVAWSGLG